MSNRGCQLMAGCLVHELGLDWRNRATYLEQYLAGVFDDLGGHRKSDSTKQIQQYDPAQEFLQRWQGPVDRFSVDEVDYSDWPIN